MNSQFVSEPIQPDAASFDTGRMAAGEPGLPHRFTWRDHAYEVAELLDSWKQTGPCSHGSGERYVRKHFYRIRTTENLEMTLYCDRQPRPRQTRRRWWLYKIETAPGDAP